MSRAILNRLLLLTHGQGDHLDTPCCTGGGCRQGRTPAACDCDTELAGDLGPDASRVIAAPDPLPDDVRAHVNRMAFVIATVAFSAMAALLGIADQRWVP